MHHWFVAYIDPGAGSLIVQATIASILAVPFLLRRQIGRALRVLARLDVRSDPARRPVDPSS